LQQAKAASTVAGGTGPASSCADVKESLYIIVRGAGGLLQAFPVASKTGNEASDAVARSEH